MPTLPAILCAVTGHRTSFIFDIICTGCAVLERPTIRDLLEHVAEYHELECGCGVIIAGRVGHATTPFDEHTLHYCADTLPLHTPLESLGSTRDTQVTLVIEAGDSGSNEFLRLARMKRFQSLTSEGATVFRRTGDQPVLPSAVAPSFASICATPGSVFVDKSTAVQSLLAKLTFSRVTVMRRPRGFGKSTLLSMLDAFFDPCTTCAHFPFIFDQSIMSDGAFRYCGQLLVFHLDLADISPYPDGTDDGPALGVLELGAKCLALLDAAAAKFYERYREILEAPAAATARPGFAATFDEVLAWSEDQDYELCFLVDNYTAPFISFPNPQLHFAISTAIFSALKTLVQYKSVRYAFLVGDEAPGVAKQTQVPGHWSDLTDDPAFSAAVGFTSSEVAVLGQALSIDLAGALEAALLEAQRGDARLVYSPADVLSLARRLLSADTVSISPPPPISVWRMADLPEDDDEETRDRIFKRNFELAFGQDIAAHDDTDVDEEEYLRRAMHVPPNHIQWGDAPGADEVPDMSFGSSNDSPQGSPPPPAPEGQDWNSHDKPPSPLFGYSKSPRNSSVL